MFFTFVLSAMIFTSCEIENTEDSDGASQRVDDFKFDVEAVPTTITDEELASANKIRIHQLGDVQHINFMTATDNQSTIMSFLTHQYMYNLDPKTYEFIPVLVKDRAKLTESEDGKLRMEFEIRPEAKWDNGTPIVAEDVIFSLKIVFSPDVETVGRLKPYLDYIEDIEVDSENPKKFTVVCKEAYMSAETSISSNLLIMPSYFYDEKGILKNYKLSDLLDETKGKELQNDEKLKEFAVGFNADEFKFDKLSGSGPYKFVKWDTNERLILKKKENWWGDEVHKNDPSHPWFVAELDEIVYTTVTDLTTAVVALRGQDIDAMQAVPNKQFTEELKFDDDFKGKYDLSAPPLFSYDYIGLNTRDPRLADVKVRKALAHAMNKQQVVETELYGLGSQMQNIIHPLFKDRINNDLVPYEYNLGLSQKLFEEAGWKDTDGNGILDKEIDGEQEEMKFTILVNNGNDRRKTAALILKDGLKKIGVEIEIRIMEWASFLDRVQKKDFEMYVLGWAASPVESDPAQTWHTESYNGGSNYVGFGTPESDALIDKLRGTIDDKERAGMYKELQQMIHDDVPYIFLVVQRNRVVVSRKYDNNEGNGFRQGFHTNGLTPVTQN